MATSSELLQKKVAATQNFLAADRITTRREKQKPNTVEAYEKLLDEVVDELKDEARKLSAV